MNRKYHIPVPSIVPTAEQVQWAIDNIWPIVNEPYTNAQFDMGRVDFDQSLIKQWSLYPQIKQHLDSLGVGLRRIAAFYCRDRTNRRPVTSAHIDAYNGFTPLVARFNIPITGQSTAILRWWDIDINDTRGQWTERHFIEYEDNKPLERIAIKTNLDDWSSLPYEYETTSPGTCWNRTDVGHQMNYYNPGVPRFVLTAEPMLVYYSWDALSKKLASLGYC